MIVSTALFFIIYGVLIQGFLSLAHHIDVYFVNELGFYLNSGLFFLIVLLIFVLITSLWWSYTVNRTNLFHYILCVLFFYIGTSSYTASIIRGSINASVGNAPINSQELLKYIRAEQFGLGEVPLLRGYYFNAPLDEQRPIIDSQTTIAYNSRTKSYEEIDNGIYSKENYAREFTTFFPRMYSRSATDKEGYQTWTTVHGQPIEYNVMGKKQTLNKPAFSENLSFFLNYQVNWLYLRYLFWNFVGKQNDNKGDGNVLNGNWITGFNAIDKYIVGDAKNIPEYYKKDLSRDVYYGIPFLLAIIGLFVLFKNREQFVFNSIFFLTFGIGIIIYVNPTPLSLLIRERDYIFIGSFIPFCIWLGLATIQLHRWFSYLLKPKAQLFTVSLLVLAIVPLQLLAKGWDDHNRNKDVFAYEFAKAFLDSCPENTILITNGDNMTFPIWHLQETRNYRKDVRVINFDQLNLHWYIDKLQTTINPVSGSIKISLPKDIYIKGADHLLPLKKETDQPVDLNVLYSFLSDSKTKTLWNGKSIHYIPSTQFSTQIDSTKFDNSIYQVDDLKTISSLTWEYTRDFYPISALTLISIIENHINDRPIAFAINGQKEHYVGLENYTIQRGTVDLLAPVQRVDPKSNPKNSGH